MVMTVFDPADSIDSWKSDTSIELSIALVNTHGGFLFLP